MSKGHQEFGKLKGNPTWSVYHAIVSLKRNGVLNIGVILLLALGVALPTTVFTWAESGARITVENYFEDSIYQFRIQSHNRIIPNEWNEIIEEATQWPEIEIGHAIPSTVGMITGDSYPEWNYYQLIDANYLWGIKDVRVIPIDNELLNLWETEFEYRGNFSLSPGCVLVSENFIKYAHDCHALEIDIGSEIQFQILTRMGNRMENMGLKYEFQPENTTVLKVTGVYKIKSLLSQLSRAFPSISRDNWNPGMPIIPEPVLGIDDSIMIMKSEISEEGYERIETRGFFPPDVLLRASLGTLFATSAKEAPDTLKVTKTRLDGEFPQYLATGVRELDILSSRIDIYVESQILTVMVFPVLIMSLMLTVFTSEASINRRKMELQTLRAKGASYNQVISSLMMESILLAIPGFVLGIILAVYMAPLLGSMVGFLEIDFTLYMLYLNHTTFAFVTIAVAGIISLFLPGTFVFQILRLIETVEIGQPMPTEIPDEVENLGIRKYLLGLLGVLVSLLAMPVMFAPTDLVAILQILIATGLLYVGAYFGSRIMRLVTTRGDRLHIRILGQKGLYVLQSFRRRKGHFMPLLVILTLTLSTTTMILIQTASFDATVNEELEFVLGSDVRVECDSLSQDFVNNLTASSVVGDAIPVLSTPARITENEKIFLNGINPLKYLNIGHFPSGCFVDTDPETALSSLGNSSNGVLISQYHADLLGKGIGDTVQLLCNANRSMGFALTTLEIVGLMNYAPGFGAASTHDERGNLLGSQLGFQAAHGGFALANLEIVERVSNFHNVSLFLVDTLEGIDDTDFVKSVDSLYGVQAYSPKTFDLVKEAPASGYFIIGLQGYLLIEGIACLSMGLASIGLFLGSAVAKRKSEYAIMRALGATQSQVRAIVFGEFAGAVLSALIVSTLLGIVFGLSMTILTFGISPFSTVVAQILTIPVLSIIAAIGMETSVLVIACIIPASKASNVEPMAILRNL